MRKREAISSGISICWWERRIQIRAGNIAAATPAQAVFRKIPGLISCCSSWEDYSNRCGSRRLGAPVPRVLRCRRLLPICKRVLCDLLILRAGSAIGKVEQHAGQGDPHPASGGG
jgi:hypothetical protein